LQVCNRGVQNL